jgi:predicted outer membrane protein
MATSRRGLGKQELLVAALVVSVLAGCSTSQNQAPTASAIAPSPEVPPSSTQQARPKHLTTRASPSPVASTKQTAAMVLSRIHQTNQMEIALGKIAQGKASMSEVRAYADQLVQDHTNADQTVVAMAQKSGMQLQNGSPTLRQSRHETAQENQLEQKLKSASGADFDRLYLQQTSSDHERLIRKLQQDREDATDDQLEALIDNMIPILEQHRELAQILMKKEPAQPGPMEIHG